jgi:hypothetical protein
MCVVPVTRITIVWRSSRMYYVYILPKYLDDERLQ